MNKIESILAVLSVLILSSLMSFRSCRPFTKKPPMGFYLSSNIKFSASKMMKAQSIGASIITIDQPSRLGFCSIVLISSSSFATPAIISWPSSG